MLSLVARLFARQEVRFLAIGATNTVVGFVAYGLLTLFVFHEIRFGYLLSLVCSYAIGIAIAFVLYRRFVFVVTGNVLRDFVRFVMVYVVVIITNLLLLPVLVEGAGLPPLVAQAVILVVSTLMSFFGHKGFSFRREPVA